MSAESKKKPAAKSAKLARKTVPETVASGNGDAPEAGAAETPPAKHDSPEVEAIGEQAAQRIAGPNPIVNIRGKDFMKVLLGMFNEALQKPQLVVEHYAKFVQETATILQGKSKIRPERGDRRFMDPTWAKSKVYGGLLQVYLAGCKQVNAWIDETHGAEDDNARAKFLAALINDALAPTNTMINPTAIRKFLETGGESAVRGISNLLNDVIHNEGWPSQVNKSAFEIGRNLALTPGSVVFRNEMIELIHYQPATDKVHCRPLLVVPPQINKFYVFDLSPEKSFADFIVHHGIETFIVSWRNPTPAHREWGFDDYIENLEHAVDAVLEITGSADCNVAGACSGGATIAMLLGYFAAAKKQKVHAVTLLVSLFDASTRNVLGLFATEEAIEAARRRSYTHGVLEGKDMAKVFSLMRPNDLIWNYWVNNYLLGNEPPAFDILYWNCDTTRLPAKLHGEMLTLYKSNPFISGTELKIRGLPINLKEVKCDLFSIGGVTDHITPWDSCYRSIHLFGGKCEFVLSNSGHIQSILNPPGNAKATYFTNTQNPESPQEWLKGATKREDTWWWYWLNWMHKRSGPKRDTPKTLGSEKHPVLGPAPGTYVFEP